MNQKDQTIIEMLMRNSRIPLTVIAKELGVSETAVRKRIKRLEHEGIIRSYTIMVNPFFLGYDNVALVGVDTTSEKLLDVIKQLKRIREARYIALSSGDHMIMFEVWCKTQNELEEVLKSVGKMQGVTKVCPAIILKEVENRF